MHLHPLRSVEAQLLRLTTLLLWFSTHVVLAQEAPHIQLLDPVLPVDSILHTTADRITLTGRVTSSSEVMFFQVNRTDVPLAANGSFHYEILLHQGDNLVKIGAANKERRMTFLPFSVVRNEAPPMEVIGDDGSIDLIPTIGAEVVEPLVPTLVLAPQAVATAKPEATPTPVNGYVEFDENELSAPTPLEIHALIIGVGKHQFSPAKDLQYPAKDAQAFYDFLTSPEGLNASPENIRLLVNEHATRLGIIEALNAVMNKGRSTDVFFLYFSGHGNVLKNGGDYCFFTFDSRTDNPDLLDGSALTRNDLMSRLENGKVGKKILFLDACYSGMVAQTGSKSMGERREHLFQEMAQTDKTLAVFTSSSDMEESYEDGTLGGGHGIFTYYMIKGLQGDADRTRHANNDGKVTAYELDRYLQEEVDLRARAVKQGQRQTPKLNCDRCADLPLSVTSAYDIEKAVPKPLQEVAWNAPPVSPKPNTIPVNSPTGRNYEAYKMPPVAKELYKAPENPRVLSDQVYGNTATGDKVTFYGHYRDGVVVSGILGGTIILGQGTLSGTTIKFIDRASTDRLKESYLVFSPDSATLSITLNLATGSREKYSLARLGVAKREALAPRRFQSADGQVSLCVYHHYRENVSVSGHVGSMRIDAQGTQKGDVIEFVDDRKDAYSTGQLVLSDDWTAAQGVITFSNGTSTTLALNTSYMEPGYVLNDGIYTNGTKDQSIHFHGAYRNDIQLSGVVGEENILCKGTVKGDVVSVNDDPANEQFLPSKLVLRDKGRVLEGDIIFKDGTVVRVNMTRAK